MRSRSWMILTPMLVAAVGSIGCSDVKSQNALLNQENDELRAQLADRNSALTANQDELRERNKQIAELRRDLEYQQQPVATAATVTGFEEIDNVTSSYGSGEVVVAVESDVLFASGKTTLKQAAKASLEDVAGVLNRSYGEQLIRIEGHTDSDPIRKSGFASNYHLAFERAYAVREYLVSKGVEPARISLASFGPHQPRATKSESRRVEIVVIMN